MRLIDADETARHFSALQEGASMRDHIYLMGVLSVIDNAPTIDAEPVRHDGDTTFITTGSVEALDAYRCRIIVESGRWCRVFYEECSEEGAKEDENG